jgi:phosphopantothenoylcysteine decarboxylase/phosphopantothenate--cysteine ligase
VLVGFAAETSDLVEQAQEKLRAKRLDFVVANDVSAPGVGFGHDTNAVTIVRPGVASRAIEIADKRLIARAVVDEIVAIRTHTVTRTATPPT